MSPVRLGRRSFLELGALGSVGLIAGCGADISDELDCVLTPQQTAGPFYFDPELERVAIDEGREGTALTVELRVVSASDCGPLVGAVVDLWHADAAGLYSGYPEQGDNRDIDTTGETFCRGIQITDANGAVTFATVFPGWYPQRTVHCHFMVRASQGGAMFESTGQFYFPDSFTAEALMAPPYATRGPQAVTNATDGIAGDPAAEGTLVTIEPDGAGYRASLTIGIA